MDVNAQSRLGVIGGLNFSTMEAASDEEIVGRTVMGLGGVFSVGISNRVRLKIEPMFLQKFAGVEATATQPGMDTELTCIEVPVLLKVPFGNGVQPYFVAGPVFSYLVKSEVKTDVSGFNAVADVSNILKAVGLGISAGGGVDIPLGPVILFLEGRYTWDLSDLNKGGTAEFVMGGVVFPVEIDKEDVMKSRGLQLMAGILVPL